MISKFTNAFGKVYLTIKVDVGNKWLQVIWEGYLSESNLKTGGLAILDAIKSTGVNCVLNNMLTVLGPVRTTGWVSDVWAPEIAMAGLKHMALVLMPDTITSMDVSQFHQQQTHFQTEVFGNLTDASDWLTQLCSQPVL